MKGTEILQREGSELRTNNTMVYCQNVSVRGTLVTAAKPVDF